jgi:hypothetical protein
LRDVKEVDDKQELSSYLFGTSGEPEIGQAGNNDMKSRTPIAALRKLLYDFSDFEKAAWPTMGEQERYCTLGLALLMDEMDVQSLKTLHGNVN